MDEPPDNASAWHTLARAESVADKSIHDIRLASASKFKKDQYLMLRVLWKSSKVDRLNTAKFGLTEWVQKASEELRVSTPWQNYCASFKGRLPEGTFALPQYYQRQVSRVSSETRYCRTDVAAGPPTPISHRTRSKTTQLNSKIKKLSLNTPTKPPRTPQMSSNILSSDDEFESSDTDETPPGQRSIGPPELWDINFPKTKDEQIVNTALVDLLNAFLMHRDFPVQWSLYRKPFIADFESASLEARTDGCLEEVVTERVHALVEVKPLIRARARSTIAMQEAAQMVAWIKNDPDRPGFKHSCGR